MRTRYNICQRSQCGLYLRYRAAVLGDEVGIHPKPFRRERQDLRGLLRRLFVHGVAPIDGRCEAPYRVVGGGVEMRRKTGMLAAIRGAQAEVMARRTCHTGRGPAQIIPWMDKAPSTHATHVNSKCRPYSKIFLRS
jgi:hypothetical protein